MSASSRSSRSACAFSSSRFCSSSPMRACSSCVWVCPPGAGGEAGTGERSTGERKPEKERKKERERSRSSSVRKTGEQVEGREEVWGGARPSLPDLFKGGGQAAATLPKLATGWGDHGHPGPFCHPPRGPSFRSSWGRAPAYCPPRIREPSPFLTLGTETGAQETPGWMDE